MASRPPVKGPTNKDHKQTKPILLIKASIKLSDENIKHIKNTLKYLSKDYYTLIFDEYLDAEVITDKKLANKLRKYCIDDIKDLEI